MFGDDEPASDLPATVPYIVIVISDFDAAMDSVKKDVLPDIQRLTFKGRAAGIHLVIETVRPDKKALPRELLANIPCRVAFKAASEKDSKVIIDEDGAGSLLGHGDALVRGKDGLVRRVQTPEISDVEVESIVAGSASAAKVSSVSDDMLRADYRMALQVVVATQRASTSHLQRQLGWGYNHAAKIMDLLTAHGVVSPPDGTGPRKVLVDTLPEPQMAELCMKLCVSFEDLRKLRKMAADKGCDVDGIVSALVAERLGKIE